jgi:6-phospho-3-hexuloisomerase
VSSDRLDSTLDQILAEVTACVRQVSAESLAQAGALIESASRIFVAGPGRSGLCMRALAMRLMHIGKTAYVVGETTMPAIAAANLLIIGLGSGQTTSLLTIVAQARRQGAIILLFTTDATSPLAEQADYRVIIPAPAFKTAEQVRGFISMQPLGTLFEQSLFILCDCLILGLMQRTGVSAAQMAERHAILE